MGRIGQIAWNKGKKGLPHCGFQKGHPFYKGGEKSWFKKGVEQKKDAQSPNWKGDKVGRVALHQWVMRKLGKPRFCEHCKSTTAKRYDWANISLKYKRALTDWKRLCRKCHIAYDKTAH